MGISLAGDARIGENDFDAFLRRPSIDPGEKIELGVFVSEAGRIDEDRVGVFHDRDDVIDLDDPGTVRRNLGSGPDESEEIVAYDPPDGGRLDRRGCGRVRQPAMFRGGSESGDDALEWRPFEGNSVGGPAYIFEINTREAAPPGDYPLPVVVTYRSPDGVKRMRKPPTVHVNDRRERRESWLTLSVVAVATIAVLAFLVYRNPPLPF